MSDIKKFVVHSYDESNNKFYTLHPQTESSQVVDLDSHIDKLISPTYATIASLNKKQDNLTFDSTPTTDSGNPVTSDGIKKAIAASVPDLSKYYTKTETDAFFADCTDTDLANMWK